MTLSSQRPDPIQRLSGEGRIHWLRGLLIVAAMAGVVLIFLVVFSLLQSISHDVPQIRGLAATTVAQPAQTAAAKATGKATAAASATAGARATATAASPTGVMATSRGNPFVRAGPGVSYPILTNLSQGETVAVIGRTSDSSWYQLLLPDNVRGWSSSQFFSISGNIGNVPAAP